MTPSQQDLSALLGRFATDSERRTKTFLIAVPIGALAAALGGLVLLAVAGAGGSAGPVAVPGVVCGLGIGVMLTGAVQDWLSVTRASEVFALHERGLAHTYTGTTRVIGWADITKVRVERRNSALYRALGQDVRYRVKLRPGTGGRRVLVITGLTEDAARLGEAVRQAAGQSL